MRRLLGHGLPYLTLLLCVSLVLIQGCSRSLLQTYPASDQEIALASEAFAHYQEATNELCGCCLDAEIDAALSVSGWFSDHTGKLSGYLQAMEPSYIKFIAVNPLGQPLFILMTDGTMFKSFNIFEQKAYSGSVHSKTYKKFAPPGFDPQFSYYMLTGRLQPGENRIGAVSRDREQDAFWLQIHHAGSSMESMVLFDPEDMLILRHVLRDDRGAHLMDVMYKDHQPLPLKESKFSGHGSATIPISDAEKDVCRVPAEIMVSSKAGAEKGEIKLHSLLGDARFSAADFHLDVPDNFEQLFVK